ncbi:MAG: phosphomannomutase/phosphoglucomutase [Pyrinomonadaceae bacterium]
MDTNIFREYDIRGIVGEQLSDETVGVLGRALGTFFAQNGAKRIALGYDARESSTRFCDILTAGLTSSGRDVVLIGMVPTPVLYQTVYTRDVDGGVMITGSHNPPDHNGFKICLGRATLFGPQIQEIREIAERTETEMVDEAAIGKVARIDVIDGYVDDIVSRIDLGPRKLKAVIDGGNGMGGVTAGPVYEKLGVELVKLFTDPDPNFPNHHPDPTVTENLQDVIAAVSAERADLGIAFDGDGDRIGVVDESGRIIWGDELMILLSRTILEANPGAAIIAEVKCSQNLFDDIEKNGGTAIMERAGHSIIKSRMKASGALLAGEMSGHIFFADRFYGFDDATYAGARLLEIMSRTDKKLSQLFDGIPVTFSTPEIRTECPDDVKFDVVRRVAEHFERDHRVITIDGARIIFEHGWGLVRASNTQAILVLRFEAETNADLEAMQTEVEGFVRSAIRERSQVPYS